MMRETPLSNCERDFIVQNISNHRRLDGRQAYDYRDLRIAFGVGLGCCHVELGKTRVLAQVSCQVGQPKPTQPHNGVLFVNVELSPMASPSFEAGRQTDEGVELSRLMERCLKDSRCLDLESLCIVSGEKAWIVRVDVHVLNHDGNILDCSSIAAISALAHFKRPDVTVQGQEITIHSIEERNPVPLSLHHMPLLVSFAFFEKGKFMLLDPTEKEEKVMEGKIVVGMNKHRELCTLQVTGQMLLLKDQVLRCSNIAVMKVTKITEVIVEALRNDKEARSKGEKHGFAVLVSKESISANHKPATEIPEKAEDMEAEEELEVMSDETSGESEDQEVEMESERSTAVKRVTEILSKGVGAIGEGGASKWLNLPEPKYGESSEKSKSRKRQHKQTKEQDEESSEEEETHIVQDLT